MTPIDLIPFAENSQKVPKKSLIPRKAKKNKPETLKLLMAHYVDFGAAFIMTSLISAVFSHSLKLYMVTKGLESAYSSVQAQGLFFAIFPLQLFGYFFFSYFLNHGQTPGMFLLKKRIDMNANDFSDAFRWATHSFLLCFSWGLSYLIKPEIWNKLKAHDHLYHDLMSYTDVNVVSPVRMSEENKKSEENWRKAA